MSKNARSRLWSRWLSRKPAAELPARGLGMETLEDRLAPATFTWSGAGTNPLWSTAANWQGNLGPAQLTYQGPTTLTVLTT
jgi:hypothetical protein